MSRGLLKNAKVPTWRGSTLNLKNYISTPYLHVKHKTGFIQIPGYVYLFVITRLPEASISGSQYILPFLVADVKECRCGAIEVLQQTQFLGVSGKAKAIACTTIIGSKL
jgi:hypothetical protein